MAASIAHSISAFVTLCNLDPWMHVLCGCGGAWAANKWVKVKQDMLENVNEIRAYKGLPPVVGTHHYVPFMPPSFDSKKP